MFYGSISTTCFHGPIDACANSGYQALLPHGKGLGTRLGPSAKVFSSNKRAWQTVARVVFCACA